MTLVKLKTIQILFLPYYFTQNSWRPFCIHGTLVSNHPGNWLEPSDALLGTMLSVHLCTTHSASKTSAEGSSVGNPYLQFPSSVLLSCTCTSLNIYFYSHLMVHACVSTKKMFHTQLDYLSLNYNICLLPSWTPHKFI